MSNRKPVIAHVLHRLYLAGAEVLAAELARKLSVSHGTHDAYDFVFFCLDDVGPLGEQLTSEGFTVLGMDRQPGIDRSIAKRIHQAIVDHKVDLVHAHQYTPFFYSALSRGLRHRPPILFTEHGRHYPDQRKLKHVIANKLLLRKRDRATAVGEHVKALLSRNEGIASNRIEVVLNGCDPAEFAIDKSAGITIRQELEIREDQPILLQVARFHPVKDHGTAIRAFAEAVKQVPEAVFVLAGGGDDKATFEALANELGIQDSTRFLGVRKDIPSLMAAADAFVLSSLSEGISVTLLEAMGASIPIAATEVGGNPEVVEHGVTGLLSPRSDHHAMASNLVKLLTDAQMRQRMGDAGHARLHEKFTQKQMHDRYAAIYHEMLTEAD